MESIAPQRLSEDWDNTGLLLGDANRQVQRVMTCLTLTPESVAEAVAEQADLVLSHHPLPFRPLKSITTAEPTGRMLWELASHGISIYCPHTRWDSAADGINAQLAQRIGLLNPQPLIAEKLLAAPCLAEGATVQLLGSGRYGDLTNAVELRELSRLVSTAVPNCRVRGVHNHRAIRRIGIACGSGASLLAAAIAQGCDAFLTGEATFHQCLEAQAAEVALLLIGHFASEKFAMEQLAWMCQAQFPELVVWGSRLEHDPVQAL
jgi:dinuclear metal center YbgI/SA1388 family protein